MRKISALLILLMSISCLNIVSFANGYINQDKDNDESYYENTYSVCEETTYIYQETTCVSTTKVPSAATVIIKIVLKNNDGTEKTFSYVCFAKNESQITSDMIIGVANGRFGDDGNRIINPQKYDVSDVVIAEDMYGKYEFKETIVYSGETYEYIVTATEKKLNIKIKTPSTTTVNYGETLILHADLGETALPEGYAILWTVEGTGMSIRQSEDGMACEVTSIQKGNVTVKATIVDENGEAVTGVDGNEISASQQLTSKVTFWQKIVSFFKNLFGISRIILQAK